VLHYPFRWLEAALQDCRRRDFVGPHISRSRSRLRRFGSTTTKNAICSDALLFGRNFGHGRRGGILVHREPEVFLAIYVRKMWGAVEWDGGKLVRRLSTSLYELKDRSTGPTVP